MRQLIFLFIIFSFAACDSTPKKKSGSSSKRVSPKSEKSESFKLEMTDREQPATLLPAREKMVSLLSEQHYFKLEKYLEHPDEPVDSLLFYFSKAIVHSSFAQYKEANKAIDLFLAMNKTQNDVESELNLMGLKAANYMKLFDYKRAADTYKTIADKYSDRLGANGTAGYREAYRRNNTLAGVPPLSVTIPQNAKIQTLRSSLNQWMVMVNANNQDSVPLLFNMSAGTSVMSESAAKRLKATIFAETFPVGEQDYVRVAVIPVMKLDDVVFKNVVVMVVQDDLLASHDGSPETEGTLGFPEIQALSYIKIDKRTGVLDVASPAKRTDKNMMFTWSQQMVVMLNDSLLLALDAGGRRSGLSVNYYQKNKTSIDLTGKSLRIKDERVGKDFAGYEIKNFPIKIGAAQSLLPAISVYAEPVLYGNEFDGALGQDVISQYDYMVMDFKNMRFALGRN